MRAGVLDEAPLGFVHPLLRTAVYREMAAAERAEGHGRAARLLAEAHASPARVAEHLLATAPAGDAWVVEQLRAAAWEATARGGPESGAAYLRRAVAEPPSPEVGAGLLELGVAEFSAGQPGWHDHLEAAVEAAGDDTTRTCGRASVRRRAAFPSRAGRGDPSVRWRRRPPRQAGRRGPFDVGGHGGFVWTALRSHGAVGGLHELRALLVEAAGRAVPRQALSVAAFRPRWPTSPPIRWPTWPAGPSRPARVRCRARRPAVVPSAVLALNCAERYDEAQVILDAAVIEAQAAANGMILPAVLAHRAWLALRRGDLIAAEADARALLRCPGRSPPLLYALMTAGVLVEVLVERGDLDGAERALGPLAAHLPGTSMTATIPRHARGRLRFAQRRFGEALSDFRAAGEIATGGLAISPCWLAWRSDAALAALAFGEPDTARRLSDEELELARAFGAPRGLGVAPRPPGSSPADDAARTCCAKRSRCSPAPTPASNRPAPWPTWAPCCVAATSAARPATCSAKPSSRPPPRRRGAGRTG